MLPAQGKPASTLFLVAFLEAVPRSDAEAQTLRELCRKAQFEDRHSEEWAEIAVAGLQVLDALTILPATESSELRLKARSETALYLLRSLAFFLRGNLRLISDWKRPGLGEQLGAAQVITSGPQLVYLIESLRIAKQTNPRPTRVVSVSLALIKAKLRGRKQHSYLVQYDNRSHQYQLIGGRQRAADRCALTTMKREIEEELIDNNLVFGADYSVHLEVPEFEFKALSRTYGAYTEYHFTAYHAYFKRSQLKLGPNDRWITLAELLSGRTKDDSRLVASDVARLIDNSLQGGLQSMPSSFEHVQKRSLYAITSDNAWEVVALTVSLLGILATVVTYLLSR